jgi:GT2 family glycosyltransferase
MPQPNAETEPSVAALARTAVAQGHAALAGNDPDLALRWLERAHRLVPRDPNVILSLASICLQQDPERAARLFGTIVETYDVRQAWLGLAASHLRMDRLTEARGPLSNALTRHAFVPDIISIADQIAGGTGWCSLTSDGKVMIGQATDRIEIRLDGRPIRGTNLPRTWPGGNRVDVLLGGRPALGSPIQIRAIRRIAGCVEVWDGGIRGWAWHPGDPDIPVELTLAYPASGRVQTIKAITETVEVPDTGPLARPRTFCLTKDDLIDPGGPIHVQGPYGDDLLGSPLNPAAEWAGQRNAALLLGQLYPTQSSRSPNRTGVGNGTALGVALAGLALRADAPIPAKPDGADGRKRAATVVIPVHDGAPIAIDCLRSVLASVSTDTDIVVIDDGSSDAALIATLDDLARRRKIRLLRQPRALGFPASANAGILAAKGRDVVLLNSDTLVPPGWLDRMRTAAYSALDIGTVTPLSNDASILSYPGDAGTNPRPDQAMTNRLDRVARRANGASAVDIPVGVGFCLYLRRDCLNSVGLLRADIFAQGYGEENDFCLRGRRLGWRHVALTGLFVGHHGGISFGASAGHLKSRNARLIEQLHPGYDRLIARFMAQDPLADARRRIDLLRWRANGRGWRQAVVLITHDAGGGVESQVAKAARSHAAAGRRPIVLRPAERANGDRAIALHEGIASDLPNLVYTMPRELPALLRLLRSADPACVEVHHFLGHPQQAVHDLVSKLGVPYDVHIHDYAWLCPRVSLVGAHNRYCGEPELADCEACVADLGHFLSEEITVAALRARSASFLAGARQVITPSDDTGMRIRRYFSDLSPVAAPHEDDTAIQPAAEVLDTRYTVRNEVNGRVRVCVVGGIGVHKGYDVLLACARDAARRNLALEFVVIGNTIDDGRLLATGRMFVTGGYQPDEAVGLIVAQRAVLGFVPSIWPETWCLGLGDIWRAGLTVAAFDIGAPAERIRRNGRGFLLPLGLPANAINNALVAATQIARHI